MKIPSKVQVGGIWYKVEQQRRLNGSGSLWGQCSHNDCVIRVATHDDSGNPLSPQAIFLIFAHEVNHAIDFVYLNNKFTDVDDEDTIQAFSSGWNQVIPQLLKVNK